MKRSLLAISSGVARRDGESGDPETPVDANRVGSFLRGYLSSSHGGRLTAKFGLPAATGILPCFSPAPGCTGFDGDLDVLDGLTVYDVHTSGLDRPTTQAALDSFRIG